LSEKSQLILLADYNQLMNQRLFEASAKLSNSALTEDKGAFFKSVLTTLNHIMVGDILWLKRFSQHPTAYTSLQQMDQYQIPTSLDQTLFDDLSVLTKERERLDAIITAFCNQLKESDLDGLLKYLDFRQTPHRKRFGSLILHVFLHQIHHRGQVSTLLSQEGIDFGDTDLPEIVPDCEA